MEQMYHEWFINAINDQLKISKDEFDSMKEGYYNFLLGQFRELEDKSQNLFKHITDEDYNWD